MKPGVYLVSICGSSNGPLEGYFVLDDERHMYGKVDEKSSRRHSTYLLAGRYKTGKLILFAISKDDSTSKYIMTYNDKADAFIGTEIHSVNNMSYKTASSNAIMHIKKSEEEGYTGVIKVVEELLSDPEICEKYVGIKNCE
jgi:S-formylglutathione hydrolase FrmB